MRLKATEMTIRDQELSDDVFVSTRQPPEKQPCLRQTKLTLVSRRSVERDLISFSYPAVGFNSVFAWVPIFSFPVSFTFPFCVFVCPGRLVASPSPRITLIGLFISLAAMSSDMLAVVSIRFGCLPV